MSSAETPEPLLPYRSQDTHPSPTLAGQGHENGLVSLHTLTAPFHFPWMSANSEENPLQFYFYSKSIPLTILYCLLSLLSCLLLPVVCRWSPRLFTLLTMRRQQTVSGEVTHVLVQEYSQEENRSSKFKWFRKSAGSSFELVRLQRLIQPGLFPSNGTLIYFDFKKIRFVYEPAASTFKPVDFALDQTIDASFFSLTPSSTKSPFSSSLRTVLEKMTCLYDGPSNRTSSSHKPILQPNRIDIRPTPIWTLIWHRLSHPFYLFQIFSVIVWFYQDYTTYAIVILVMSTISLSWEVFNSVRNVSKLRALVKSDGQRIYRFLPHEHRLQSLSKDQLVVGDLLVLDQLQHVPCDVMLLNAQCIVDESSLTGESLPVVRTPVSLQSESQSLLINRKTMKQHCLIGGSKLLQTNVTGPILDWDPTLKLAYQSQVVPLNQVALGVVMATGFATSKGHLFRSILHPKPLNFSFYKDSVKFLLILLVLALAAFGKRVADGVAAGSDFVAIVLTSLDIITIAVPPALPLILSVGVGLSMTRLQKKSIYCIDPERINFSGRTDVFCFDKTGTLTQPEMDLFGVRSVRHNGSPSMSQDYEPFSTLPVTFQRVLATCHSLSTMEMTDTDLLHPEIEYVGGYLEIEMFKASGCQLLFSSIGGESLAVVKPSSALHSLSQPQHIIKRFDFSPLLQRSTVIVREGQTDFYACTKGSVERVLQLCQQETLPSHLLSQVSSWSSSGFYVLACASKQLAGSGDVKSLDRSSVESGMTFEGLLFFRNEMKVETPSVILNLQQAGIDTKMITGDHVQTAIYIAKLSGILSHASNDHPSFTDIEMANEQQPCMPMYLLHASNNQPQVTLIQTGKNNEIQKEMPLEDFISLLRRLSSASSFPNIVVDGSFIPHLMTFDQSQLESEREFVRHCMMHAQVFARTQPQQKTFIVEILTRYGLVVGMCGDGTNDCGALKAAHYGLSLSTAEASIVSPFTSRQRRLTDVLELNKEGRCALTTSFIAFKFMILYPVIQAMMSASLNNIGQALGNNQFLFDDMAIVLVLSLSMLYTRPASKLGRSKAQDNLFSFSVLASVLGQVFLCVLFYALSWVFLFRQPWFCSGTTALGNQPADAPALKSSQALSSTSSPVCYPINQDDRNQYTNDLVVYAHENNVTWLFAHFQYWIVALVFNLTPLHFQSLRCGACLGPSIAFRQPVYRNLLFLITLIAVLVLLTVTLLNGPEWKDFAMAFGLVSNVSAYQPVTEAIGLPLSFRYFLYGLMWIQLAVAVFWEVLGVSFVGLLLNKTK